MTKKVNLTFVNYTNSRFEEVKESIHNFLIELGLEKNDISLIQLNRGIIKDRFKEKIVFKSSGLNPKNRDKIKRFVLLHCGEYEYQSK